MPLPHWCHEEVFHKPNYGAAQVKYLRFQILVPGGRLSFFNLERAGFSTPVERPAHRCARHLPIHHVVNDIAIRTWRVQFHAHGLRLWIERRLRQFDGVPPGVHRPFEGGSIPLQFDRDIALPIRTWPPLADPGAAQWICGGGLVF
jgi:hypothetical protein